MSTQRPDPANDAVALRAATADLLEAVAAMDPGTLAGPSLLPGWSRGHVLTHLARNADAVVNLLTWARTGEEKPMYGPGDARERAIEAGADRPLAEHLTDLGASCERLAATIDSLEPRAWAAQVSVRGRVLPAAALPARRLTEVHLHRVDLGTGYTCADAPRDWVDAELDRVLDGLTGHEGIAPVRLRETTGGTTWLIGAADRPEVTVEGDAAALLTWVTGRGDGDGLTADPALPLPVLPPLG